MRKSGQRGDTIVEVLLAIVVVSVVLVAAYQTTSYNIDDVQSTQEHSEALQLAQAQLEYLHNSSTTPNSGWCFSAAGSLTSGANCMVNASGTTAGTEPKIFQLAFNNAGSTYEITVKWASIQAGTQYNYVNLYYQP